MRRLVVVAFVGALGVAGTAQEPPPPPPASQQPQQPIFRAGVDLIEIDVGVVDDRGRPVRDLLAPEFTVTVDGQPRKVVNAEFISLRGPDGPARRNAVQSSEAMASANTEKVRGRLVMIAVDRESIGFGNGRNATRAAAAFLDKLGANDRVSFLTVPQPGPFVDFTSNHDRVRTELERSVGIGRTPKGAQMNIGIHEALVLIRGYDPRLERELLQRFCGMFQPGSAAYLDCVVDVNSEALSIVQQVEHQQQQSIRTLTAILEALGEVEGPKSLVWISEGLIIDTGASELTGLDRLAAAANTTLHVILLDVQLFDVSEQQRSPTAMLDRDLQVRGLETLAGYTRGALYRVSAGAEFAFDRIEEETSGYYLLGVESLAADVDGKRHDLRVSVRRQNTTVRARREFRVRLENARNLQSPEDAIARALRSPFLATELPLRIATYAYKGAGESKAQVVIASEIEQEAMPDSTDVTLGYMLNDPDGKVVLNNVQKAALVPGEGPRGAVLQHTALLTVEPGRYTLKLAAIDGRGRRGSVEHSLEVWQMAGVPFAVSDLMLGEAPTRRGEPLQPHVEAWLTTDQLGAYLEAYGSDPASLDNLAVRLEVARDLSGASLASVTGSVGKPADANRRVLTAVIPVGKLTPGRYLARAIVTRGDEKVWESARPFHVTPESTTSGLAALIPETLKKTPFSRQDLLTPEVLGKSMDVFEQGRPSLAATIARVRKGEFTGAARKAFDANDQTASMFLRGLELYAAGDLNGAASQLSDVLRTVPDFAPAALYYGACFAAGGRDREAINSWLGADASKELLPLVYTLTADALVRLDDREQLVALLGQAVADWPQEDGFRWRLAQAHAVQRRHKEAFVTVEPYLTRHPTDQTALFVAIQAIYGAHLAGEPFLNDADAADRLTKYAKAYRAAKGPHEAVVDAWVQSITAPATRP